MQLLVIGGTHFVGRAMVEDAVARGHERDGLPSWVCGARRVP